MTPFDSDAWGKAWYEVLLAGARAEFSQNEKLRQALLSTGDSILSEASPYDDMFGIKLSTDAAAATEPNQWPGRNQLGKALMEVRAELRGGADVKDTINSSKLDSVNRMLRNRGTCQVETTAGINNTIHIANPRES